MNMEKSLSGSLHHEPRSNSSRAETTDVYTQEWEPAARNVS
jgi:hypothetical protein